MTAPPVREAEVAVEIPFHDLDPAGIAWHGHYAKYLELARCALLRQIDYNYDAMMRSGYLWPIVDMQLRYLRPLRFEDRIIVRARLVEWEYRLRIEYLLTNAASGERLTKSSTVLVAVDARTGELCLRSPDILFERLGLPP